MKPLVFIFWYTFLMGFVTNSLAEQPPVQAWLDIQQQNNLIEITPRSKSEYDIQIRYTITSNKKGKTGTSRSQQSGSVFLLAGQETGLANLKLSFEAENQYLICLDIYHQNNLISSITGTIP